MKSTHFSIPKKYWLYIALCVVLGILIVVNICVVDGIAGDKEFPNYTQQDWHHFVYFLVTEVFLIVLMLFFSIKARKLKSEHPVEEHSDQFIYAGIKPGDCDYIWADFSGDKRAIIVKMGDVYYLNVDLYERKTESWNPMHSVSAFSSLTEVKKALFFEFDFFCEENTIFDKDGCAAYKDIQE